MPIAPSAAPVAPNREDLYAQMRNRARQQGVQQKQEQGDALKRRFAAIGNLNSGAYIKASQQQEEAANEQINQATQAVDFQKAQEDTQLAEAQKGRDLQRELFDKDQAFKQTVFADESKFRDLNAKLAQADFEESKKAQSINAAQALEGMSDEALRAMAGINNYEGGKRGGDGKAMDIAEIMRRYGYR